MTRLKQIRGIGVASLTLLFLSIFCFILMMSTIWSVDTTQPTQPTPIIFIYGASTIFWIIMLVVSSILSFVGSLLIITSDFGNKFADDSKILWGLLSLLLLGAIGLLIFSVMNIKKISLETKTKEDQSKSENNDFSTLSKLDKEDN